MAKDATDRPLPHSADAERAILGAILLDNPGVEDALTHLRPSDFFIPQHVAIYRLLKEQVEAGGRPDLVALVDTLAANGELEKIPGGAGYVSGLYDGLPLVCQLATWVRILREKALLREHAHRAQRTLDLILNSNGDAGKTLQQIENLSAQVKAEVRAESKLRFRTGVDFAATEERVEWVAPGYVACGAVADLNGKIKSGKTSFALGLVRAAIRSVEFLGQPTLRTPVVYLTEQPDVSLRQALEKTDLLGQADFHALSWFEVRGIPWPEVARLCIAKCKAVGAKMLVVDTLGQFAGLAGDSENEAGAALAAMEPLQRAASEGVGVLLLRHERKSGGEVADAGRGSSAFGGAADIVLSLRRPEGRMRKTIRRLEALSRFDETPADVLIELKGKEYVCLGAPHDVALEEGKRSILAAVPDSKGKGITLEALVERTGVPRSTAQRAIEALLNAGVLQQIGTGKRGNPLCYLLAESFCPNS